jgi:hypothetical protein
MLTSLLTVGFFLLSLGYLLLLDIVSIQRRRMAAQSERIDGLVDWLRLHGEGHANHYANALTLHAMIAGGATSTELPKLTKQGDLVN